MANSKRHNECLSIMPKVRPELLPEAKENDLTTAEEAELGQYIQAACEAMRRISGPRREDARREVEVVGYVEMKTRGFSVMRCA